MTSAQAAAPTPEAGPEITVASVLRDAMREHHRALAGTTVLLVLGATFTLAEPWIVSRFIAAVLRGEDQSALLRLIALLIGVAIVGRVVVALAGYTAEGVAWDGGNSMRVRLT